MTQYLSTRRLPDGCLAITLNDPFAAVNRTTAQFKQELDALLAALEAPGAELPKGLVFLSAKNSFCVGGDVDEIAALAAAGARHSAADSAAIKALFRRIERLPVPSVACIAGTAAGGGLELALACHARFCLDDPAIRLGFPEVTLGLIPGAGGMVRAVHMLGVAAAIPLLAGGELIAPREAQRLGLLTGLAATPEALLQAACAWIAANPEPAQPWDRKGHAIPGGSWFSQPSRYVAWQPLTVSAVQDGAGRLQARVTALGCIAAISASSFADGEKLESAAFARQATSQEAAALTGLRMHDRRALRREPATAPAGFAPALRAALQAEAARLAAEGASAARIRNGARHAGYDPEAVGLAAPEADVTPSAPDAPDLATTGERLLLAQLAAALPWLPGAAGGARAALALAAVTEGGFPAWTGGPLRLLQWRGAEAVARSFRDLGVGDGAATAETLAAIAAA